MFQYSWIDECAAEELRLSLWKGEPQFESSSCASVSGKVLWSGLSWTVVWTLYCSGRGATVNRIYIYVVLLWHNVVLQRDSEIKLMFSSCVWYKPKGISCYHHFSVFVQWTSQYVHKIQKNTRIICVSISLHLSLFPDVTVPSPNMFTSYDHIVYLFSFLPLGTALGFPLAGGVCVWQPGRHHRWLEPAAPELTKQWVQHCYGISEPQVAKVSFFSTMNSISLFQVWDQYVFHFSGPMMKLVYKLQAEEYKYEIPVNCLPVRTL